MDTETDKFITKMHIKGSDIIVKKRYWGTAGLYEPLFMRYHQSGSKQAEGFIFVPFGNLSNFFVNVFTLNYMVNKMRITKN